jgi:hypothetical protein
LGFDPTGEELQFGDPQRILAGVALADAISA